ncbi:hypothetical protein RB195_015095 [Necator americanus]|uniref:Uncharacterized protein n=1 Tax=Necator americanus TaxID=51031 RepID=A0ABR1E3G5_NECAM
MTVSDYPTGRVGGSVLYPKYFEAAFDFSHRDRLLNALRTDGVPGKFVRLVNDMIRLRAGGPPGRKLKFWTEVVKEDLRTFGVGRQLKRDVRFCKTFNNYEWIDSVEALAED